MAICSGRIGACARNVSTNAERVWLQQNICHAEDVYAVEFYIAID